MSYSFFNYHSTTKNNKANQIYMICNSLYLITRFVISWLPSTNPLGVTLAYHFFLSEGQRHYGPARGHISRKWGSRLTLASLDVNILTIRLLLSNNYSILWKKHTLNKSTASFFSSSRPSNFKPLRTITWTSMPPGAWWTRT